MKKSIISLFLALVILACKEEKKQQVGAVASPHKEIWDKQWISLMDKNQWRGYNQDSLPTNWAIHDSIIECFGKAGDLGGDIISKDQYDNFELRLQWKISPEGNSGIFYHVVEDTIYHSPYETGPEYQILDDVGFPQPLEDWQKTGANYAMHAANGQKKLMPVGDWNTTRIIFNDGKVEHWLNGKKIVMFNKYTDAWTIKRNDGKWKDYPDYGKTNSGYLGLQDHGAGVWFKNIRIRPL